MALEGEVDDEPARYCIPGFIEMWRATCWLELGKPGRAIEVFENQLKCLPDVHRRDRGVYQARLALAYAMDCNLDGAIAAGRQAIDVASGTHSRRIAIELRQLKPRLEHWRDLPEVASFYHDLTPIIDEPMGAK